MKPPRNIPFGQMSSVEILQVLIDGKMPNGTVIEPDIRLCSLATIIPIIKKDNVYNKKVANLLREREPNDSFVVDTDEIGELLEKGEKLLVKPS